MHHRLHLDRYADLRRHSGIETEEAARRHPDDRHRVVIHSDRLADDVRIARKASRPIVVRQHYDGMPVVDLVVLLRTEDAAGGRRHAEHRKIVAGDELGGDPLG